MGPLVSMNGWTKDAPLYFTDEASVDAYALVDEEGVPCSSYRDRRFHASTRQPKPSGLVSNESDCYHVRMLDPGDFAIRSATHDAVTIGHCYHN